MMYRCAKIPKKCKFAMSQTLKKRRKINGLRARLDIFKKSAKLTIVERQNRINIHSQPHPHVINMHDGTGVINAYKFGL